MEFVGKFIHEGNNFVMERSIRADILMGKKQKGLGNSQHEYKNIPSIYFLWHAHFK